MFREAGQRALQLIVVRAVILHGAALLVDDGHHAVDPGELTQQIRGLETLGDVLARARGTVDRADDGDVIACAVAAVAPIVAHEIGRLSGCGRGWTVAAEGVIT